MTTKLVDRRNVYWSNYLAYFTFVESNADKFIKWNDAYIIQCHTQGIATFYCTRKVSKILTRKFNRHKKQNLRRVLQVSRDSELPTI